MDITIATDTPRIAQLLGNCFYCFDEITLDVSVRIDLLDFPQGSGRKHRARPRAKILGGEVLSSHLPQIVIYVTRINGSVPAFVIDVLKKLLSGQILAMIDDSGQAAIVKIKIKCFATLAAKLRRGV